MGPSTWRRAWTSGLALQALGPLCGFATVFLIAHAGGAAEQGRFAQAKAWVDLLVVLGCFGFPQSFVFVVNRLRASVRRLAWGSVGYAAVFFAVAWAASRAASDAAGAWVPSAAASLLVLHGLWRGLYLTARRGPAFGVFTVLPAVALLVAVAAGRGRVDFDALILLSAVPVLALATAMMMPLLARANADAVPMPWRALMANGAHVFVQALLTVAQPLLAYALLRRLGADDAGVGLLHVGVFLVQGASVPVGMVAPLLFARWTDADAASPVVHLDATRARWVRLGLLAGGLLAAAVWWTVPFAFGAGFEAARGPAALMMLTLPLACHARLVAPALHAAGHPSLNTTAAALRLATLAGLGMALPAGGLHPLGAMALAWTVAEAVAAVFTLMLLRRLVHREVSE